MSFTFAPKLWKDSLGDTEEIGHTPQFCYTHSVKYQEVVSLNQQTISM